MTFVQLQVMSTHSLMQSTLKIDELMTKAKEQGYQAIALTDHNIMYGALEFYETARENGIKPLIGLTLDVKGHMIKDEVFSFILIAKNNQGYQDLIQLSTQYQLEEKPVSLADIFKRSDHLFVISPDDHGEIRRLFELDQIESAKELAKNLTEYLPQFHLGVSLQKMDQDYLAFGQQLPTPMLALGNVQYLSSKDELPTKVLRVYYNEMSLDETGQEQINHYLKAPMADFSLRRPEEMVDLFVEAGLSEAIAETERIADQIQYDIALNQDIMPTYPIPQGETADTYLSQLCHNNLNKRIQNVTEAYQKRLKKELDVISTMGFSDYFLIVWDIMHYAHQQNIFTGSGRGSAAGSLVAYLLDITNVDPIQYDLLFERFLNKERFTLPDIDLDFPDNRRDEILEYIFKKYGADHVAQIGTFGTYKAKSAVRDVGRVFGQSQENLSRWSKAIPNIPDITLQEAAKSPQVKKLIEESEQNKQIYRIAQSIEGSYRHTSTHAAAIIISDEPISEQIPLQLGSSDIPLTQYAMDDIEKVGLLKLDILALKNLTIISDSLRYISYENNGKTINIDMIPTDDPKTLEIFQKGQTDGIFQFESDGIRQVLRQLKPNTFEDIVAVNALYRPGPMEQINSFIKRKNGTEPIHYLHDDLSDILEVTYGIMVYQEQVMQVASKMAGYTLNEADILRRDISKKSTAAMEDGEKSFVAGAVENGYQKETAITVYSYIKQFAGYGFNRSHAVAYSKLAYQMAYIKAHYPASFYAAVMRSASSNKLKLYMREAKQSEVKFLPPHINHSFYSFTIDQGNIRYGLDVIKGLPKDLKQAIINERQNNGPYKGLLDFLNRINTDFIREEPMLSLVSSGAFDQLGENRSSLIYSLPSILDSIQMSQGNTELFELFAPTITKKEEFSDDEKMTQEFEITGYYFTAEPGEKYNKLRENDQIAYIAEVKGQQTVRVMGVIEKMKRIQTKKGHPMSFVDIRDHTGEISLTLFPETHRKYIQELEEKQTIIVEGKYENDKYGEKIIVNKLTQAEVALQNSKKENKYAKAEKLYIRFQSIKKEAKKMTILQNLLRQNRGNIPVIVYDEETKKQMAFKEEYFVKMTPELVNLLEKQFDSQNIIIK